MMLQEIVTKISWRDSLHRRESAISHGSRRPQTETAGTHQWEKPVVSSRQRGIKPQRKNTGGRKSEQHPYHPLPKPSSVQSAIGGAHQESVSTATKKQARIDHQPSSARNEPSSLLHQCQRSKTQKAHENSMFQALDLNCRSTPNCDRTQCPDDANQQNTRLAENKIHGCEQNRTSWSSHHWSSCC